VALDRLLTATFGYACRALAQFGDELLHPRAAALELLRSFDL
jgi:hypothetical protein